MSSNTVGAPVRVRLGWRVCALTMICLASGLLYAWALDTGSYGSPYYAAAVKSMSSGFTDFLFGSFDPYGLVTVDKPPMSLWPQVVSVWIFGYHGWALLLPQAIEGVAAVFLLHRAVRLWAGENAALLAAALLAITPATVAVNRDNLPDALLVLLLVAAGYAVTRSVLAEHGRDRTRWLLWCAFFVGCGFGTKMLQAWLVVPAAALAFLAGTTGPFKRRIIDLLAAGGVLIASSFWWIALFDWWPGDKPYMGGSTDGSALELVFGYNGFDRIFGLGGPVNPAPGVIPMVLFGSDPGITRMFNYGVGGQVAWLLPLALLTLAGAGVAGARRLRAGLRLVGARPPHPAWGQAPRPPSGDLGLRAGWVLWGGWLIVGGLAFSYTQGIWHAYYTSMIAPPIAAIGAAGIAWAWRRYRDSGDLGWVLLPLAIAISACWAFVLASRDASWQGWTRWAVLVIAVIAISGLVIGKVSEQQWRAFAKPAFALGLVSILLIPAVWSTATAAEGTRNGQIPSAGPDPASSGGPGVSPAVKRVSGPGPAALTDERRKILDYARRNGAGAEITLAVVGGAQSSASTYIINTDDTVIGMGGFLGADNVPTTDRLRQWISEGRLRFLLGVIGSARLTGDDLVALRERIAFVEQHCQVVDPSAYGGSPRPATGPSSAQTLYAC